MGIAEITRPSIGMTVKRGERRGEHRDGITTAAAAAAAASVCYSSSIVPSIAEE